MRTILAFSILCSVAQAGNLVLEVSGEVSSLIPPPVSYDINLGDEIYFAANLNSLVDGRSTEDGTRYDFVDFPYVAINLANFEGYQSTSFSLLIRDGDNEVQSDEIHLTAFGFASDDNLNTEFQVRLVDDSGTAFTGTDIPSSINLADFNNTLISFAFQDVFGSFVGEFSSPITYLEYYPVPEPSSTSILLLSLGTCIWRRRR